MGFQLTEEQAKEVSEYKLSFEADQEKIKDREIQRKINACDFFNSVKPEFVVEFEKQMQTLGFANGTNILAEKLVEKFPILRGFISVRYGFIFLSYSDLDLEINKGNIDRKLAEKAITEFNDINLSGYTINAMHEFCIQNGYKKDYKYHECIYVKKTQNSNVATSITNNNDFEESKWAKWIFLGFLIFAAIMLFVFSSC